MNNLGSISQKILRWKGLYFESKALYTPKLNTFIDKYKVIKVACVAGTIINIYFIYDAFLTTIVLKQTKTEINDKGKIFEARLMNKKQKILNMLSELQGQNIDIQQKVAVK